MTRAEKRLYLSRAFRRGFMGGNRAGPASRFLRDIPSELMASGRVLDSSPPRRSSWENYQPTVAAVEQAARPTLKIGDQVRHATFGDGVVTACDPSVTDTEVTVEFSNGVGVKRLLLSFAPLELIPY